MPGYDNPSPNAGIYNPLQPQILMIPRRPTNLFYNVSTPDQWMAEYNDIYRSFWGRDLSYAEILDNESDVLAQYLLKGENDPWMFHQPDMRALRLGAEPARRSARPDVHEVREPRDDAADLAADGRSGRRVADRMRYNASGASGTVDPNANTVTVHVSNAAMVPVTGACGGSSEFYAGQPIASVTLPAGGSTTLSLSRPCAGSGGGGTGGTTARAARRHRRDDAARQAGAARPAPPAPPARAAPAARGGTVVALPCSALSVVAGQIGPGQSASALTIAELTGTHGRVDQLRRGVPVVAHRLQLHACRPARAPAPSPALALDVNYRGPSKTTMTWTFEVLDTTTGPGRSLGDNAFATSWVWTKHTFTLPAPLARFFCRGTLQIRYGTTSNADASDIDQLLIRATVGSGGTGTAGTTGAAGRGGTRDRGHDRRGRAGRDHGHRRHDRHRRGPERRTTGTAFSMPCSALSVTAGQIGAGQPASVLTTAELTGDDGRVGQLRRGVPGVAHRLQLRPAVGNRGGRGDVAGLQVNYRGPSQATSWTFEVLDTGTGAWVLLGDNAFAGDWVWTQAHVHAAGAARALLPRGRRCRSATARPATPTRPTSTSCW